MESSKERLIPVVVYLPASVHGLCRRLLAADYHLYGPGPCENIIPERSPWSRLIADIVEDFLARTIEQLEAEVPGDTPGAAAARGVYREFLTGVSEARLPVDGDQPEDEPLPS